MDGPSDSSRAWIIRSFRPGDLSPCRHLYREGVFGGKIAENDTGLDIDDIASAYMRSDEHHFWVAQLVNPDGTQIQSDAAPVQSDGAPARPVDPAANPSASDGPIVGMIGVQHFDGVGEIRRLRVAESYRRRGIGAALVETALKFCRDRDYLKVTLDTFVERGPAVKMFEKFRFRLNRTKSVAGKDLLYFYLDLYTATPRPHKEDDGYRSRGDAI